MTIDINTDRQLLEVLYRVAHYCATYCSEWLGKYDVTLPQMALLYIVFEADNKDLCQKDIVDELKVKGSSITSMINTMSKNGLLERKSCETDSRKYIIKGTEKGRRILNNIIKDSINNKIDIFKNLDVSEKKQLLNLLFKIY